MIEIKLVVKGMSCSHCSTTVKNLLIDERGVNSVTVDLPTGKVQVTGSEKMQMNSLIAAVNLSGIYSATSSNG